MTEFVEQDDASTPLTSEEIEGLIPPYITTKGDLNAAEEKNILDAKTKVFSRKRDVLDQSFLKNLHKEMFGRVWKWAGDYRHTGKNVGVEAYEIPVNIRNLIDDCRYWLEHDIYTLDEIAVRFHHRLVWIHPYPNGNGRHARLATDLLLISQGVSPFSWGAINLTSPSKTRKAYIAALREADKHNISPLLKFVRT